jgi:N-methylhydantoinase A
MTLDVAAARNAVGRLAGRLGLDTVDLAQGICDVANAKMAQAIRTLTVEHGLDHASSPCSPSAGPGPCMPWRSPANWAWRRRSSRVSPGPSQPGHVRRRSAPRSDPPVLTPGAVLNGTAMADALAALEEQALAALAGRIGPDTSNLLRVRPGPGVSAGGGRVWARTHQ